MTYLTRRDQLTEYFDQTASKAWEQLTSNEPLTGIRATVRAGRDEMRATILDRLPRDLSGKRLLDAFAGLYCVNVGYGRQEIAEAIADQARELAYYHAYVGHGTEASIEVSCRTRAAPT